jgi:uncharacterized phage protein gp47/JayE
VADTPVLSSKEQIYGQLIDSILADSDVLTDTNEGSVLDSICQAVASVGFKLTADMIQMVTSLSIDRASGDILKRIANDERVPIFSATRATGLITITDTSFQKIEDKIFPGLPAPVAGTNVIYIIDGSKFPSTGQIYIGRGTTSVEGPIPYTSITPLPNPSNPDYWSIQLSTPTTKFHNLGESVILAQGGNRVIPALTQVQTKQGVVAEVVTFSTSQPATILDGEVQVTEVPVVASQAGTIGNVPRGAITEILGLSFSASCFNNEPFTDAVDDDTDDVLRDRIKAYRQLKARGTEPAILAAAVGVTSAEEKKRVVTANIKRQPVAEQILVIDDGTGYQPIDSGIGREQIIDDALGNEVDLQLSNPMVVKASVKTLNQQPFDIQGGQTLEIEISGENVPVHTFQDSEFRVFRAATAFEVAASINASPLNLPYYARVVDGGTRVQIIAKTRNEIRVKESSTANKGLNFPTNKVYTLRLYKDDVALYQDGLDAAVESAPQPNWGQISSGDKISYVVDNTITVTTPITNNLFQKYGPTLTVNSSQPIDIWAKVLTDVMPGVEVSVINQKLRFQSRSGKSSNASIKIITDDPNATIGSAMFPNQNIVNEATGQTSDYILNLKTGQIQLAKPLAVNQKITAGSRFTRARFETNAFTSSSISLGGIGRMFAVIDGNASFIPLNINLGAGVQVVLSSSAPAWNANTTYAAGDFVIHSGNTYQALVGITGNSSNPSPNQCSAIWTLCGPNEVAIKAQGSSGLNAFGTAKSGDWVIFWSDITDSVTNSFSPANRGAFRIKRMAGGNCVTIVNRDAVGETKVLPDISRITCVRCTAPVQEAEFLNTGPNAVDTVEKLRDAFRSKFVGVSASIVNGKVRVESQTLDDKKSQIFVAVSSEVMRNTLGIKIGAYNAVPSHNGFIASDIETSLGTPTFKILETDTPITDNSFKKDDYLNKYDGTQNELVQFVGPKSGISESPDQAANENTAFQIRTFNPATGILSFKSRPANLNAVSVDTQLVPPRSKANKDEFILRQGLCFDAKDTISFIIDEDTDTKAFLSKVSRRIKITTATPPSQFAATDDETTLSLNHPSTFKDFDFKDFKVWTQAKAVVQGIKVKSKEFGPSGERNGISFRYPSLADQPIAHYWQQGPVSAAVITLASGPARTLSATDTWDADSGFIAENLTVNGNVETIDIKHAAGVGQTPNFLGSGGPVAGDVAVIDSASGFLNKNKGQFKVVSVSSNKVTLQAPVGTFANDDVGVFETQYPDPQSISLPAGQGTTLVTTQTPHNVQVGQKIGLYGMAPTDYIGAFVVVQVLNAYQFRAAINGIDSDQVVSVLRTVNNVTGQVVATIQTASSLGAIAPGSSVKVSGITVASNTFNGLFTAANGTGGTTLQIDFIAPAFVAPPPPFSVTNRQKTNNLATLTIGAHSLAVGNWILISGVDPAFNGSAKIISVTPTTISYVSQGADVPSTPSAGSVSKAYGVGDFVLHSSAVYRANTVTSTTPPSSDWTIVQNVSLSLDNGRVDAQPTTYGNLARVLQSEDNLRFFPVTSTRLDVEQYATTALADFFEMTAQSPNLTLVDANTQHFSGAGYVGTDTVTIQPIFGSRDRWVYFPNIKVFKKGADITWNLAPSTDPLRSDLHNKKQRIVDLDNSSGATRVRVQTDRIARPEETNLSISANWSVSQDVVAMGRAESYVSSHTQNISPAPSDFTLKKDLPDIENLDKAYLIATTAEQLSRLIGKLANSGLSNVSEVGTAQSKQVLQVKTNTFGLDGAVRLSGGKGNSISAAILGSGAIRNDQAGVDVLLDLRSPFVPGSYVRIRNTAVQNKSISFQATTALTVQPNSPSNNLTTITSNQSIFRVTRIPPANFNTRKFRFEKHGKFMCLRQIGGTSIGFSENVVEGDWLSVQAPAPVANQDLIQILNISQVERLNNIATITVNATTIKAGQKIQVSDITNDNNSFNGIYIVDRVVGNQISYYNVGNNVTAQPAAGPSRSITRLNLVGGNLGIFSIVKVFGDNIWFENDLGVEDIIENPATNVFNIYSYDSVMPGDKLNIGGSILGVNNVGIYTVAPNILQMSDTQIIVNGTLSAIGPVTLGAQSVNISITEAAPLNMIKQVTSTSVSQNNADFAFIGVESPSLITRFSPSLGGVVESLGKLGVEESTKTGLDAYRHYRGLLRSTYDVIYGDPTDPSKQGVRAAGTDIDIQPPIIRKISAAVSVRIKSGVPFTEIIDAVKSAIAGYINSRGVGQPVSISQIIAAAQRVEGVLAIPTITTNPVAQNGLINVQPNEVSKVLNTAADITVSIVNG